MPFESDKPFPALVSRRTRFEDATFHPRNRSARIDPSLRGQSVVEKGSRCFERMEGCNVQPKAQCLAEIVSMY